MDERSSQYHVVNCWDVDYKKLGQIVSCSLPPANGHREGYLSFRDDRRSIKSDNWEIYLHQLVGINFQLVKSTSEKDIVRASSIDHDSVDGVVGYVHRYHEWVFVVIGYTSEVFGREGHSRKCG